jgi:hypothetical protein
VAQENGAQTLAYPASTHHRLDIRGELVQTLTPGGDRKMFEHASLLLFRQLTAMDSPILGVRKAETVRYSSRLTHSIGSPP